MIEKYSFFFFLLFTVGVCTVYLDFSSNVCEGFTRLVVKKRKFLNDNI